jgi:hypothetical protein
MDFWNSGLLQLKHWSNKQNEKEKNTFQYCTNIMGQEGEGGPTNFRLGRFYGK